MSDDGIRRTVMPDASEALPDHELKKVRNWLRGRPIHTPASERAVAASDADAVTVLQADVEALHRNMMELLDTVHFAINELKAQISEEAASCRADLRALVGERFGEICGRIDGMLSGFERATQRAHERAFKFAVERDGENAPDVTKVN
jgi:class 3 adenylate cyclase